LGGEKEIYVNDIIPIFSASFWRKTDCVVAGLAVPLSNLAPFAIVLKPDFSLKTKALFKLQKQPAKPDLGFPNLGKTFPKVPQSFSKVRRQFSGLPQKFPKIRK
jgi:hypothetical protein